jgi:ferredoxin-type protein NapH
LIFKLKHRPFSRGLFLPLLTFLFISVILSVIQLKIHPPLLLAERFFPDFGWIEILIIAGYGAILCYKMLDPGKSAKWRLISWTVFSAVFFSQLMLGVTLSGKFLMNGNLHLPVPAVILAGPLYRERVSFMTILFLSTVILTGPAWCSHLCYFGAIDGIVASRKIRSANLKNKNAIRHILFFIVILFTLLLGNFRINPVYCVATGILFGIGGLVLIFLISGRKGKMINCVMYCPIGVLVSYLKYVNPFRLRIGSTCSICGACSGACKYDALTLKNIINKKPGNTCTLCGDCLGTCHFNALHYTLFSNSSSFARNSYLFLTVSIHAIFLALARI